jgi:hypothetical protein
VWNEQNLAHCEAGKDAKMKIDEPETPWASPPKELFSDDGALSVFVAAWSRSHTKRPPHAALRAEMGEPRAGGAARGGADMQRVAAQLAAASASAAPRGEWDASDDEMTPAAEAATHQVRSQARRCVGRALTRAVTTAGGGWPSWGGAWCACRCRARAPASLR